MKRWRRGWKFVKECLYMGGWGEYIIGLLGFSIAVWLVDLLFDWLNLGLIERLTDWADNSKWFVWLSYVIIVVGAVMAATMVGIVSIGLWRRKGGGVSKSLNEASEVMVNRKDERVSDESVSDGRLDDISERVGEFFGKAVRGVLGMWRIKRGNMPHDVINSEDDVTRSRIEEKGTHVKTNKKQDRVLFVCGIIIALMLLFPPFHNRNFNAGYGFLFFPPGAYHNSTVNTGMLVTQWLCVGIIGGILLFVLRDKE